MKGDLDVMSAEGQQLDPETQGSGRIVTSLEHLCLAGDGCQQERTLQTWKLAEAGALGHWGAIEDLCVGRTMVRWAFQDRRAGYADGQTAMGESPGGLKLALEMEKSGTVAGHAWSRAVCGQERLGPGEGNH